MTGVHIKVRGAVAWTGVNVVLPGILFSGK